MIITVKTPFNEKIISADGNLLTALQAHGFLVNADCGGRGVCGKCGVLIARNDDTAAESEYVLACRYDIAGDITVFLDDGAAFSTISGGGGSRKKRGGSRKKRGGSFGLAADIGTTSVALYLVNLESGEIIDSSARLNTQKSAGADVMSRITAAGSALNFLNRAIHGQLNEAAAELCRKHGIQRISRRVITGNTTMLHLYLGIDPSGMGVFPFSPAFTETKYADGAVILPSADAFIGSDIVAGILSCGMHESNENALLVDIGTNAETILKYNGKYFACSAAAGPAFEGANIEKGMGGIAGAVDHAAYTYGKLTVSTVSGTAKGICGSGLIDLTAILKEQGIIDTTGLLTENGSALSNNISDGKFYITKDIYLSQKDIRQFQLAKSAVRAGIETLLHFAQCPAEAVSKVYLAGGMGYHIDIKNAVKVGLLPAAFTDKATSVGNAAGLGAIYCLIDEDNIGKCQSIAESINTVDLTSLEFFTDAFLKYMAF